LTVTHYRAIHRHLFGDVYAWAGQLRTVRIAKGGNAFCYPENIAAELRRLFGWLRSERYLRDLPPAEFATKAAHFLAELNAVHPFREGNGRAQSALLAVLAAKAGHKLAFERLDPAAMLAAMIRSFQGDEKPLARQIAALMRGRRR